MNNKNYLMFRNGLLVLGLLLGVSMAQAQDSKMAAKSAEVKSSPPVAAKKNTNTVKFSKENSRLNIEHLEKMRSLSIKNINTMFDRMVSIQKAMNKLSEDAAAAKVQPDMEKFKAKNEEMRKEGEKAQIEFQALNKAEDEKFQSMMKKRQEEMSKNK